MKIRTDKLKKLLLLAVNLAIHCPLFSCCTIPASILLPFLSFHNDNKTGGTSAEAAFKGHPHFKWTSVTSLKVSNAFNGNGWEQLDSLI